MKTRTIYTVCRVLEDWGVDTWAYTTAAAAQKKMYELLGEEIEAILEDDEPESLFKFLSVERDEVTKYVNYIQLTQTDYITVEETIFFEEN